MSIGRFLGQLTRFTGRQWTVSLSRDLDDIIRKIFASLAGWESGDTTWIRTLNVDGDAFSGEKLQFLEGEGTLSVVALDGTTVTVEIAVINPPSSKGALWTHDGSTPNELAAGTDGYTLLYDSGEAVGLKAVPAPNAKGSLWTHDGSDPYVFPAGTDTFLVGYDSTAPAGLVAVDPATLAGDPTAPGWKAYTFTHTQFQTAGLVNSLLLRALAAGEVIHAIMVRHTTQFTGAGITDYKIKVGILGSLDKYTPDFDVDTATSGSNFQLAQTLACESATAVVNLLVTATSAGANLNQSNAGVVVIYVLTSQPGA